MRSKERMNKWAEHIEAHKASGQTVTKWCEANSVNAKQFYNWRKRLSPSTNNSPTPKNLFIQAKAAPSIVPVNDQKLHNESSISIRIGMAVIDLHRGFEEDMLTSVVRAVTRAC